MRLYGKRPVLERLKAAPKTIRMLILQQDTDAAEVVKAAKTAQIRFFSKSRHELSKLAPQLHTQGVLADVEDFRYAEMEDLLKRPAPQPTLILLDRVTDPQNLGAILRTLACLGGFAVILPRHESAEVNETVLRIACGGENYVPVARVTNLVQTAEAAKQAGYWIAGAVPAGGTPLHGAKWPGPLALVLGSEGTGIRPGLQKQLELKLSLPMPGAALSFNVATAVALIGYEVTRRKLTERAEI